MRNSNQAMHNSSTIVWVCLSVIQQSQKILNFYQMLWCWYSGVDTVSIGYFKIRISQVSPRERVLHLAIDRVYILSNLSLVNGSFFWEEESALTKTLPCAHVITVHKVTRTWLWRSQLRTF